MNPDSQPLPNEVRETLRSVRQQLRRYIAVYAVLIIACWLLLLFWLGGVVDFLPVTLGGNESPRWLRIGWLLLMAAGTGWVLFGWALPRLIANIRDRSLALLIERHYPQLNYQLITAVESHSNAMSGVQKTAAADDELAALTGDEVSNPQAYQRMLAEVEQHLGAEIGVVQAHELFDWKPVIAGMVSLTLGLLITALSVVAMPGWMNRWSQRLFALTDQAWPRKAELRADGIEVQLPAFTGQLAADRELRQFVDGTVRFPRGSAGVLQIAANADRKQVPEVCTLFYETETGTVGRANLRRVGSVESGWQQFILDGPPLDSVSEDLQLNIVGLDFRLDDLRISAVEPAVVKDMKLLLRYPNYLASTLIRSMEETVAYRSGMLIPQGTEVSLIGTASADLKAAQFVRRSSSSTGEATLPTQIESVGSEGSEFKIDLGTMKTSHMVEVRLIDSFGLASDQIPRYVLGVKEDTLPEVTTRLDGIGNAVTPEALIPIRGTVFDDHGIQSTSVELTQNDEQAILLPLKLEDSGQLAADIDLRELAEKQNFSLQSGDSLVLLVTATDYFDLDDGLHTGSGQPKQLQIVTPDDLLVLLDREELELRQRLEIIISELEQLQDSLDSLLPEDVPTAAGTKAIPHFVAWQAGDEMQDETARQQRMKILKAQQAVLQGDKSQQELLGVAINVDEIRKQLVNNRIDSYDRQQRLAEKVHQPLIAMLDADYPQLSGDLAELQTAAMSGNCASETQAALRSLNTVLIRLSEVKDNMKYLESFNEIIDLVRNLLEDQDRVLKKTEETQRARILQLLK